MKEVSRVGFDIAKKAFQVHRAGNVVVRCSLRRRQVVAWFARLPRCLVGMEAWASAQYWARELATFGHEVRLIAPAMRFVAIKSEQQQAAADIRRVRDLLIKQQTMLPNQPRGLMAEFGIVAAKGRHDMSELLAILSEPEDQRVPSPLREGLLAVVGSRRSIGSWWQPDATMPPTAT